MNNYFPTLPAGTVLNGKYRIEAVIGSGGMGHVYKAVHVMVHRHVAIKTLFKKHQTDDVSLGRFQQEARIAGAIGHDNICEVMDFGMDTFEDNAVFYTVMPLLIGMSFGQWLATSNRISPHAVVDIIAQALLGLQAAHEHRIVHRDLKPDNIFITSVGDRPNFVKLLDFGISKHLNSDGALELTRTGITLGTPLYMPPEQARGAKYIDHRADIYSIGVVLYEALVGTRPYDGASYNEVLVNICTTDFPRPSVLNPIIPPALERVILRAMARAPEDRYDTAAEMRAELLHALDSLSDNSIVALSNRVPAQRKVDRKNSAEHPTVGIQTPQVNERSSRLRAVLILTVLLLIIAIGAIIAVRMIRQPDAATVPVQLAPSADRSPPPVVPAEQSPAKVPETSLPDVSLTLPDSAVAPAHSSDGSPRASSKGEPRKRDAGTRDAATEKGSSPTPAPTPSGKREIERNPEDVFD